MYMYEQFLFKILYASILFFFRNFSDYFSVFYLNIVDYLLFISFIFYIIIIYTQPHKL